MLEKNKQNGKKKIIIANQKLIDLNQIIIFFKSDKLIF